MTMRTLAVLAIAPFMLAACGEDTPQEQQTPRTQTELAPGQQNPATAPQNQPSPNPAAPGQSGEPAQPGGVAR